MFLQIKTPTGYKDLSTIQVGDEVCAFDTEINIVEGIDLWTAETNDYENQGDFTYYLINGTYKFYKNQSIYVNDVINHVFMLQVGDIIYDENDKDVVVTSIEELTNESQFYRVRISNDHTYILDGIIVHNFSRYWVGGGSSANWNATANTNWAATSGGANNQSVPTSTDDVIFDSGSAASTFNGLPVAPANTILSFRKEPGYTGTITRNVTLVVAGNFTDNTASTWAGTQGMQISATSTMTSNGQTWGAPLTFNGTSTKTLLGNWSVTALSIIGGTTTLNKTTTETLTVTGGMSIGNGFNGTADVFLTGGTWSGTNGFGCASLTIAGNVTISSGAVLLVSTLIYSSGTVTVSAGTFNLSGNCTLNTAGITWSSISISTAGTVTLNSLLTISNLLILPSSSSTFTGTAGFTCGSLLGGASGISAATTTLAAGITYTVTSAFGTNNGRIGAIHTFTSSSGVGGTKAILTLNQGATCNVLSNFTRIDASNGRTIRSFNGTITDCSNIVSFTDIGVSGF